MLGTFFFIVFAIVVAVIVLYLIFAGAGLVFGIIVLLINGVIWAFKKLFHIGVVRRQHTTCEGCMYLQDKKSCHDRQAPQDPFAAASPVASPLEGEARYCYRKQFWRGKRN
jgi:hypothetical protein